MITNVSYSKRYRIHAVRLYNEYNSSVKAIKILGKEMRAGKWSYDTVPTPATIMKWVRKYEPEFETMVEDEEDDPIKRYDLELMGITRGLQLNAGKAARSIEFKNVMEVIAALKFCNVTRRELATLYKNNKTMMDKADKLGIEMSKALRVTKKNGVKINKEIMEKSLEAIDFLSEREKRGIA